MDAVVLNKDRANASSRLEINFLNIKLRENASICLANFAMTEWARDERIDTDSVPRGMVTRGI
jgi:hypothetical protein